MSYTSDTSDQGRNLSRNKRATISNILASTPVNDAPARRYTTSLSRIDTNSSLSEGKTEGRLQSQIAKKGTKKRKKVVKNKRKPHKKRVIQLNDTKQVISTEWDTESEESIDEALTNPEDSIEGDDACINLFDDPCTPEKIRDAPITYESPLSIYHSPIIRSSRRFNLVSKRNNIAQRDKLLPVNIPSSEVWYPEETDEDEIILVNRTNNVKTYYPKGYAEKNSQSSLGIYWNNIYPSGYFSLSDLLWEEFVKKNRKEISQYLAPSSARVPVKEYDSEFQRKFPDIPPKFESLPVPPGMICIRGRSNRVSQKWVTYVDDPIKKKSENKKNNVRQTKARTRSKRKQKERMIMLQSARNETNVFDIEDEIDTEFETGGQDGKRMSLSEFRQKRKHEKSSSASCHSRTQQD